jgi:hypothetical protein
MHIPLSKTRGPSIGSCRLQQTSGGHQAEAWSQLVVSPLEIIRAAFSRQARESIQLTNPWTSSSCWLLVRSLHAPRAGTRSQATYAATMMLDRGPCNSNGRRCRVEHPI